MEENESRLPLLRHEGAALDREDAKLCTGDGSTDISGRPALKHGTGNWRACSFILGNEFCERLAYYGIAKNLITYLKTNVRQSNVVAAMNVNTWQGTCYLTPLIGATFADSCWGRYWTIAVFSSIYFVGMVCLTLSASVPALKPPDCAGLICPQVNLQQLFTLYFGLYIIALGTGGIKPCVSSFGADQFDDTDQVERARKGSFFNWFYFSINTGSLISGTFLVWVQDSYGWAIGFGIPTIFMGLAIVSFFICSKQYRMQKPGGSPIARMCQVAVAAIRNRRLELPTDSSLLYEVHGTKSAIEGSRKLEHTDEFRFLDKAALVLSDNETCSDGLSKPWMICTVTQVEELKILLRMFPIWVTNVLFSVVYSQNSSMFIEQGMVLDKRIGPLSIPPASLSTFDVISVIIWIPIYDRILVPLVRMMTGRERGFSELQRMGIGLFLSMLAVLSAALVEVKRLDIARAEGLIHKNVAVTLSILCQIPQYSLVGAAEVFTAIGQLEFFYNEAPDAMRSLCVALVLLTVSVGEYVSSLILYFVSYFTTQGGNPGWIPENLNEGHLDRFFLLIAGLSLLNLLAFVYFAMKYRSKSVS